MSVFFNSLIIFICSLVGCDIVLYMLSSVSPTAQFFARLLASYLSMVVCALYGVLASIFLRLIGYGRISQWATARSFKYVMKFTTGMSFKIDDPNDYLNRTRPAVFIGNHQTELDVLMLANIFPKYCSVTAKSSLRRAPFLGWFMTLSGTVFIDRQNSSGAREAMVGAAEEIRRHRQSVYMFPEGTRSYYKEPDLLPFKKGAFHLAVQAGVPIVPVVVANYSNILNVRSWTFKAGKILVKVLKPIDTAHLTPSDVDSLTQNTRDLMLKELVTLTAKQRRMGHAEASGAAPVPGQEDGVVKASSVQAF